MSVQKNGEIAVSEGMENGEWRKKNTWKVNKSERLKKSEACGREEWHALYNCYCYYYYKVRPNRQ